MDMATRMDAVLTRLVVAVTQFPVVYGVYFKNITFKIISESNIKVKIYLN